MQKMRCLTILFCLILIPFTSANFACGSLITNEEISPSWFEVLLSYDEFPEYKTQCQVSPEDHKYCCDPQNIKEVSWDRGKIVNAMIQSEEYIAYPVSLTISGEGFDIFPDLELKKVLNVETEDLVVGEGAISASINTPDNPKKIEYFIYENDELIYSGILCEECNSEQLFQELPEGKYKLVINAIENNEFISSFSKEILVLDKLEIKRQIICDTCDYPFIPSDSQITIKLSIESSMPIEGSLIDYYPIDWVLLNEQSQPYSESHNSISWDISGQNIEKEYQIQTPNVFLTKEYVLFSEFKNNIIESSDVTVFSWYKFLPISQEFFSIDESWESFIEYNSISPKNPLIQNPESNDISTVAIFPKGGENNVISFVGESTKNSPRNSFVISSNLDNENVDYVLIRYKSPKKKFFFRNLIDSNIVQHNSLSNENSEINSQLYNSDDNFNYYEAKASSQGIFSIKNQYKFEI